MSKLTVKDVFDLTPDLTEVIHGCRYRQHAYDLTQHNVSSCYKLFQIQKYHEGKFICYKFRTRTLNDQFDCGAIARSFYAAREIYSITLKPLFLQSNYIQLISFIPHADPKDLPLISRRYYSFQLRWTGDENEYNNSKVNYMLISGDTYSMRKQPKPYDTQCMHIDANMTGNIVRCRSKCNIEAFKHHNLLPPNEINIDPLPLKHMTFKMMKNLSLIEEIKERQENCSKKCSLIPCHDWYSVTVSHSEPTFSE